MLIAAYAAFALAHLTLAIVAFRQWRRLPNAATFTLMLPIIALVYDNTIAAIGAFIGEGSLLYTLTLPRFVGHAFLTPIWIVSTVGLAAMLGVTLARKPGARIGSWILYGAMVVMGVTDALILLDLQPLREGPVLVYTNVGGLPGPPAPALVMVAATIFWAVLVLLKTRWPWMLAGALFMLVAAGIPAEVLGFVLSASGEVVLAAALVATERRAVDVALSESTTAEVAS